MRKIIRVSVLIMALAIPVFADEIPNGVTSASKIPNGVTISAVTQIAVNLLSLLVP